MIYFDNAATSLQKPPEVIDAAAAAIRTLSSPGRGGYPTAVQAADVVFECRSELQELFGASSPEQVVFTANATYALNIAIRSLVPEGGKVVISGWEHNAVTRPLFARNVRVQVAAAPMFSPEATLDAFAFHIRPGVDAVICSHVSNVFGCVQPVREIGTLCRRYGIPFIVDASQSAGILPLNLESAAADFLAMPGHKGLYGPQGTGVLVCREGAPCTPLAEGGTGSRSAEQEMPDFLPDRLEAGTHNVPGIAGLLAGIRFVKLNGLSDICARERYLAALAAEGLRQISGVDVFSLPDLSDQTGVLSFRCAGLSAESVGAQLAENGIAVRTGFHCAPLAHRTAGTLDTGTVRVSFSVFNTREEIYRFLEVMHRIRAAGY